MPYKHFYFYFAIGANGITKNISYSLLKVYPTMASDSENPGNVNISVHKIKARKDSLPSPPLTKINHVFFLATVLLQIQWVNYD